MTYRIYVDESGTHGDRWLIIGMLFVPDHGALHVDLCKAKDSLRYFRTSSGTGPKYREVHFSHFRSNTDVQVGKLWIDAFVRQSCFYRSIVVDWGMYDGRFFGDPFEPDALKKRRAYKKWAELLLQPEVSSPPDGVVLSGAEFYLDRLRIMYGYDVVDHLRDRFTGNYEGRTPYIRLFQHTDSAKDANQCLQLCDLLTGCLYQQLCPSSKAVKTTVRDYLSTSLSPFGVREFRSEFWRSFDRKTLRLHFPKFSAWFWEPTDARRSKNRQKKKGNNPKR